MTFQSMFPIVKRAKNLLALSILLGCGVLCLTQPSGKAAIRTGVTPFRIAEFKNEPFVIKQIMLGQRTLGKTDSLDLDGDWLQQLVINGINQTSKEIAYISYGIDFDSADNPNHAYRLKLERGKTVFLPSESQTGDSLRLLKGDQFKINFNVEDRRRNEPILQQISKLKGRISEVSIFVEMVAFTDDTMWTLGSWLKRSAKDSERYEPISDKVGYSVPILKNDRRLDTRFLKL